MRTAIIKTSTETFRMSVAPGQVFNTDSENGVFSAWVLSDRSTVPDVVSMVAVGLSVFVSCTLHEEAS